MSSAVVVASSGDTRNGAGSQPSSAALEAPIAATPSRSVPATRSKSPAKYSRTPSVASAVSTGRYGSPLGFGSRRVSAGGAHEPSRAPVVASTAAGGDTACPFTVRAVRNTRPPTTSTSFSAGTTGAVQPAFGASVVRSYASSAFDGDGRRR